MPDRDPTPDCEMSKAAFRAAAKMSLSASEISLLGLCELREAEAFAFANTPDIPAGVRIPDFESMPDSDTSPAARLAAAKMSDPTEDPTPDSEISPAAILATLKMSESASDCPDVLGALGLGLEPGSTAPFIANMSEIFDPVPAFDSDTLSAAMRAIAKMSDISEPPTDETSSLAGFFGRGFCLLVAWAILPRFTPDCDICSAALCAYAKISDPPTVEPTPEAEPTPETKSA
mmetsp:Transcript_38538/g.60935  ORF Transcript_38538/g.60935 Transcript_38538/m.60935 type:complete len:232 (-) Transcript_38538:528-1223(-)